MRRATFTMSSLRRLARSTRVLLAVLAVLAPIGLGPATGAIAHALGALDHACACGMAPGKCGCPACARLERERSRRGTSPVLESNCERDGAAVPVAPLPPCVLPSELALDVSGLEESLASPPLTPLHLADRDGPPTPPPRV
ncbi:MAG: hypothetical protein ACLP1X_09245 [Polyangiaceae bacterium]